LSTLFRVAECDSAALNAALTRTYPIDAAPEAFADLVAGRNARGIIVF
jgi:hypothetical protein